MIIDFRHKGLQSFFQTGSKKGIIAVHEKRLNIILAMLDVATTPKELDLPGFRLHPLKGDMKDHWAIWVSGNWRVVFRFNGTDVECVDYQDYH
jgi:Plasmid maintenance system killer protein